MKICPWFVILALSHWKDLICLPGSMYRLGAGWIIPYGDESLARVPYAERIKLGGSSTVRGWRGDHVGPYVCGPDSGVDCLSEPGVAQPTKDIVALGGLVAAYGGAEFRICHTPAFAVRK